MAQTHRGLLRWFASDNPWMVTLKVLPIFALYIWGLISFPPEPLKFASAFIAGLIGWSLFEYSMHRWIYHTNFSYKPLRWFLEAFHLHHHRDMSDHGVLNAGLLLTYPLTAFFLGIVYLITFDIAITCAYGLGMTLYYNVYEFIHYYIHYRTYSSGYMNFIQKYHLYHHYGKWSKNFGNTITFWDHLFGTYDPLYKDFQVTNEHKIHFITGR